MQSLYRHSLITGGSSGIGLALACSLTQQGCHVALLARNPQRLEQAVATLESLRQDSSQRLLALSVDVSQRTQVEEAIQSLLEQGFTPELVISAAGEVEPGYASQLTPDDHRCQVEINYLGSVYVTQAVLPHLRAQQKGHLVFLSSILGLIGVVGYSAYSPSKAALGAYANALRMELKGDDIGVSIAYPSDTDTPQLAYETTRLPGEIIYLKKIFTSHINSPDQVAQAILDGVRRNKGVILTDFDGRLMYLILRLLGVSGSTALLEALLSRYYRNNHKPLPK